MLQMSNESPGLVDDDDVDQVCFVFQKRMSILNAVNFILQSSFTLVALVNLFLLFV